jgi:predicted 3-demethylubiquinone-9 3-methyltransferase (glyoxalase superfamily)
MGMAKLPAVVHLLAAAVPCGWCSDSFGSAGQMVATDTGSTAACSGQSQLEQQRLNDAKLQVKHSTPLCVT